ncbi:MAG: hypothetical protein ABIO94_08105, partial [Opitutaceae bacterium]
MTPFGHDPSSGNVIRTLKDGYWDRTEVVASAVGEYRVRKRSKGAAFGPWGIASLRREIAFLRSLPATAAAIFPAVRATWDDHTDGHNDVGYEMPFYADHLDAGVLARDESLTQDEIDEFQDVLAETVFHRLHEPMRAEASLANHVGSVIDQAWLVLEKDPVLARLIDAPSLVLNGEPVAGPRKAFEQIRRETDALSALDAAPCVRLHGDFFLENILWRPARVLPTMEAPRLLLIDPVSVAGVSCGPAVFDLVKYVSYATGELLALRSEWVDIAEEPSTGTPRYLYRIRWENAELEPFRTRDWHKRFSRAFEVKHGAVDRRLYELIDGYFSVAMAVNTSGTQRRARLLKATAAFHGVLNRSRANNA